MKRFFVAILVALVATVTGFAQNFSVGPYPLGKSKVNAVPTASIAIFLDRLEAAKSNDSLFLHLEGKYDSVKVAKNNLNDPFNYLIGEYRAVALRELAIHAGFPKARIVTERAKLGKVREVSYWFSKDPNPSGATTVIVNNNADSATNNRQDRELAELREQRRQNSIAAANKPSLVTSILKPLGVGYARGLRAGARQPGGLNAFLYFADDNASIEVGWAGWGTYQQGHTVYAMAGLPLSKQVDVVFGFLATVITREDKELQMAPYRNDIFPGAGGGIRYKAPIFLGELHLMGFASYQPQMYWTGPNGIEFPVQSGMFWLKGAWLPFK